MLWSTKPLGQCRLGETLKGLLWQNLHDLRLDNPRRDQVHSDGRHANGKTPGQPFDTSRCMEAEARQRFRKDEPQVQVSQFPNTADNNSKTLELPPSQVQIFFL